ncbi:MAG: SRPBCC domain-containing protein [Phycisphaerales bacterium JB064]
MSGYKIERVYPHPRERVWRALTDRELLARWLMPNDFYPEVGHNFTFRTEPGPGFDGIVRCVVTELNEPESVAFSWKGGPIDTLVRIELHDHELGTRLVMSQTGFHGPKAWLIARMLQMGSKTMYGKRLPAVLDELAGVARTRDDGPACMKPTQRALAGVLSVLERRSK